MSFVTDNLLDDAVIDALQRGGVGVLPTDTVYGIVARASDQTAVSRLYELKHREHKPGTVIAASVDQLVELGIKRRYLKSVEHFWPGAVSVEMPHQLEYLHQGTGRQAFRIPNDSALLKILEKTGPLQTSSANQPGETPAKTLEEAKQYFGETVDFYVDGGEKKHHQPSTIIRIVDDAIEIIREGAVKIDENGRIYQ